MKNTHDVHLEKRSKGASSVSSCESGELGVAPIASHCEVLMKGLRYGRYFFCDEWRAYIQGHSDFLTKVHGFPDLLSWSFPGVFSVLWLANNYRLTSLPPRSGEFRSSDHHSRGNLRRGNHWRTGGFLGNSWFSCISLRVLIGEKAKVVANAY